MSRLAVALLWATALTMSLARAELIVDRVGTGYAAANAGLAPGDHIDRWREATSDAAPEKLVSPFDLIEVSLTAGLHQTVVLHGHREGEARQWQIRPGFWSLGAQPAWTEELAARIEAVLQADGDDFGSRSQALLDGLREQGRALDAAWLAKSWSSRVAATDPMAQDRLADRARKLVREAGRDDLQAQIHEAQGVDHGMRNRLAEAIKHLNRALDLREATGSMPLQSAWVLNNLGIGYSARGDLERAIEVARRSVALKRAHAADSLTLADSLHTLGNALFWQGDLDGAEAIYQEMFALRQRLAPDSIDVARSSHVLGNVQWQRGRLDEAQALYAVARRIHEASGATPAYLAQTIMSEGYVAHDRRDIATAESRYAEALAVLRDADPGGDAEASTLMALGNSARFRLDLEAAREYFEQAQAIFARLAPEGERMAVLHTNLAVMELAADRLDAAEAHARRSLELFRAINPDGSRIAAVLFTLAEIAAARGQPSVALDLLNQSRELIVGTTASRLRLAAVDLALGSIALDRDEYERAAKLFSSARELAEADAPGSLYVARATHGLGLARWRQGDLVTAAAALEAAVSALDEQRGRLGGDPEQQGRFAAAYDEIYRDHVLLQYKRSGDEAAFEALLRLRQASVDALLAPRGLALDARSDPARGQQLSAIDRGYEKLLSQLASGTLNARAAEQATRRLVQLRAARSELLAKGLSRTVDADHATGDGAVLVAWMLGEHGVLGLVRRDGRTRVHTLPATRAEIEDLVRRQRVLLGAWRVGKNLREPLDAVSQELYRALVAPLAADIKGAGAVTLLPDGALWRLAFPALVSEPDAAGAMRYWVAQHALRVAALPPVGGAATPAESALLFAYAMDDVQRDSSQVRDASGSTLLPLQHVAEEVEAIAQLVARPTMARGALAREQRVKQVDKAALLHLASHAVADPRRAMDSFLVLAPGEGENGLLHAWEVYEQMALDVDLVSLSACDTAAASGAGLLGLSWAFHAAGARKVLGSQWSINDRSTSVFMQDFYRRLRDGSEPVAALAAAQRDFAARDDDWSHPFHWAAFQISER